MMAARVLALVRQRYYDNGNWHRVEPDFVIQGGGPGTNEYVGYQDYFRDELGTVPHVRGTLGMSTRSHDTGDAQWFVNLKDNLRLGRDYTVFGEVVSGIDVVEVKRQESRHPVPNDLAGGFGPDFVLDDIVAPLKAREQPFSGQFVLEPRRRVGEGARNVREVVVDRCRARGAWPVDRRRSLSCLFEDVEQEGNSDQLLLGP